MKIHRKASSKRKTAAKTSAKTTAKAAKTSAKRAKDVLRFAPNFTAYVLPPDAVCLYSEDRKFFLHGELYCALAAAIGKDGKSAQVLHRELSKHFPSDKIEEAIKPLRYRPNDLARGLRLQRTHSIAIVVPDLSNNFYIELVRGAKDYSASSNYTVLIGDSRDSWEEERNYLDSFHRRRVDGAGDDGHGSSLRSARKRRESDGCRARLT